MAGDLCNNIDEVKAHLNDYGVAVLLNVINPADCDRYCDMYHEWLRTFPNGEFPFNRRSLVQSYNIAHHPSTWAVRLGSKHVFEELWATKKLLSSTDGIAIGQPPELGVNSFDDDDPESNNFHIDQSCRKQGLHAYQGAVYLEEASDDDWCFQVLVGSHKQHKTFFKSHRRNEKNEFRRLDPYERLWYAEQGCEARRIPVPKGGMVLWDSRTVHAGAPPKRERPHKDRWRFVVFVSMTPAIWARPNDIQTKRQGYRDLCVSRHWSSQGFGLFRNYVQTPQDIQALPDIAKTPQARLLVGDLTYDFSDGQSNGPRTIPVKK